MSALHFVACTPTDDETASEGNAGEPAIAAGGEPTSGGSSSASTASGGETPGGGGQGDVGAGAGGEAGATIAICEAQPSAAGAAGAAGSHDILLGADADVDTAADIALDGCGNVLVAGTLSGDATLRSYAPDGSLSWSRQLGEGDALRVTDVVSDADGISYVVGVVSGDWADQAAAGGLDAFVRKLDALGNTIWTRLIGSADTDSVYRVELGGKDALFLSLSAGRLASEELEPGGERVLAKVATSDGSVQWARRLGSDFHSSALAADALGGSYVVSDTFGTFFDAEGRDAFVNLHDLAVPEGTFEENNGPARGDVIAASPDGKQIYVAGVYGGDEDFELPQAFLAALGPTGNTLWVQNIGFANGVVDLAAHPTGKGVYLVGVVESWGMAAFFDETGALGAWEPDFGDAGASNGLLKAVSASAAGTAALGTFWQWGEDSEQLWSPWAIARDAAL
jgi:hypothetical protein